ncbi:MAG: hypothetical protein Kow0090_09800 [Myxococcota bacterium]
MNIICPHCFHNFDVPDKAIAAGGTMPCPKCGALFPIKQNIEKAPSFSGGGGKPLGPPILEKAPAAPAERLLTPQEQMMFEPSDEILKAKPKISLGDMGDLFQQETGQKLPQDEKAPPPLLSDMEDIENERKSARPDSSPSKKLAFGAEIKKPSVAFGEIPKKAVKPGISNEPSTPSTLETEIPIQKPKPLPHDVNAAIPAAVPSGYKAGSYGTGHVLIEKTQDKETKSGRGIPIILIAAVIVIGGVILFLTRGTLKMRSVPGEATDENTAYDFDLDLPEKLNLPERGIEKGPSKRQGGSTKKEKAGSKEAESKSTAVAETPVELHKRAQELNNQKRYREAFEIYRKLIAKNPKDADAFRGLGIISEKTGDKKQAVKYYEQYLRINPNAPDANKIREFLDEYYD